MQCPPKVLGQFVKQQKINICRIQVIPCKTTSFSESLCGVSNDED